MNKRSLKTINSKLNLINMIIDINDNFKQNENIFF